MFCCTPGKEGCCRQMSLACGEHSQCSGHTGFASTHSWRVCFLGLHCSGSRLLYREQALRCMRFQFPGTPQRCRLGWACVLCLPRLSSSGSQELDERTLPKYGAPSPLRGPSLSFLSWLGAPCVCSGVLVSSPNPPGRCRPSRISGSLWLETGSLFAVW